FGALTQCIDPTPYIGRVVRLIGYLYTYQLNIGYGGLWMRVDSPRAGIPYGFDNMRNRGLRGTMPWTPSIIELPVPADATRICFGAILQGQGALWVDDLQLSVL